LPFLSILATRQEIIPRGLSPAYWGPERPTAKALGYLEAPILQMQRRMSMG
jgi:hypothetical protein